MKKGSLAVFDNDENYTESFLEYIEEKKGMPFEIQVFTKQEPLLQYLESRATIIIGSFRCNVP